MCNMHIFIFKDVEVLVLDMHAYASCFGCGPKKKQIELDYELLKRCFETLTEEIMNF